MKRLIFLYSIVLVTPFIVQADSLEALDTAALRADKAPLERQKSMLLMPKAVPVMLEHLIVNQNKQTEAFREGAEGSGVPVQVGLKRNIPQLKSHELTAEALNWSETASGGKVAAISVTSPNALSLRIGMYVNSLPSSASLRFYAQDTKEPQEVHATEVLKILASNLAAGDSSDQGRIFWSPPIVGDEITLEIELPAGILIEEVDISLPTLSHLYLDPAEGPESTYQKAIGDSGSCNINYQCEATQSPSLDLQSRAVAKMSYIVDGDAFICTGTLLNNTRNDKTPYFLSANHCISNQVVASTLVTYWLYRASGCFSTQLDSGTSTLSGGAELLYTNAANDTSFFKLNQPAPGNATFAGWSTDSRLFNLNQATVGIHNPSGDMQKVSKGSVVDYVRCTETSCTRSGHRDANAIEVIWNSGVTEGGSSGSGLFNNTQLIGQLYGGGSSCANRFARDQYSLFAPAYEGGLKAWLSPTTTPNTDTRTVVEFYNPDLNHYFITADEGEQNFVDTGAVGRWLRTGQIFKAGGASAACRFYGNTAINPKTGNIYGPNSHFYTVDQKGCNELIELFNPSEPSWKFESYEFFSTRPDLAGNCPAGTRAVHRLYNNGFSMGKASNHRFVSDLSLIAPMTREGWLHEGVDMCSPL